MRTPIITLWQPWATWIALGIKTVESRTHDRFKGLVGKTIGIHAGNTFDKNADDDLIPANYPKGAILCTAYVTAHRELSEDDAEFVLMEEQEMFGRYGLFLDKIQVIDPFPIKGQMGIWYSEEFDEYLKQREVDNG